MPVDRLAAGEGAPGLLHWTIGLWGTDGDGAEAGLTAEQYWQQIIHACFLDDPDPIARWREIETRSTRYRDWLNSLPIERLHLKGEGHRPVADDRRAPPWVGGSGRNIPSFEVFTVPTGAAPTGTSASASRCTAHGTLVKGVRLEFKDGLVVGVTADAEPGAAASRSSPRPAATGSASSR